MREGRTSAFQRALDAVERLTLEEKELLFDVAYRRLIEERRARLATEIAEAREAYRRGEVRRGSVDDLLTELIE
jgi:DNA replication initiation complex subunit (GINS family)